MNNPIVIAGIFIVAIAVVIITVLLRPKVETLVDQHKPKPDVADPGSWVVGPVYNGQPNPSKGMPLHPVKTPDGFAIPFIHPDDEAHYVTMLYGALTYNNGIRITGYVEGGPFVAASDKTSAATLCLYFQRQFDDWQETDSVPYSDGDTESFRWWATPKAVPLVPGPFTLEASFADLWTACEYSRSQGEPPAGKPQAFRRALDNAGEVGFTCGGGTGWGHGVAAPAGGRIVITKVEML